MARNASGEVGQVGQQITRSNLSIQPTLTVRPGFSVNVIVTKDMIVPPYPDPPRALGLAHE
jgi:type IV secretion system protein VirB10